MSEQPEVVVVGCGPFKGERHAYKCRGCGMESDNLVDFNTSTCWECGERIYWGDLCQQERHEECVNGDPDSEPFCPCPCHDKETPVPAGTGIDPAASPRSSRREALPDGIPGHGRAGRPDSDIPPSTESGRPSSDGGEVEHCSPLPGREGAAYARPAPSPGVAGEDGRTPRQAPVRGVRAQTPSLPGGAAGEGSGKVEPPTPRLAPARTAPGATRTSAPGATPSPFPGGEGPTDGLTGRETATPGGADDPAGGNAEDDAVPLAGQQGLRGKDFRDAVRRAQAELARQQRNQRARPWTAKRAPGWKPGMGRRQPPDGPGAA